MSTQKTFDGGIRISDIINNQLIQRVYYGYNRTEAKKLFKNEIKALKKQP